MFGIVTGGFFVEPLVLPCNTVTFATPVDDEMAVANSLELLALPPRLTNSRTFRLMMAAYCNVKSVFGGLFCLGVAVGGGYCLVKYLKMCQ